MKGPVDELKRLIKDDRVVVFVGSGVSASATGRKPEASWMGLLKHGVEWSVANRMLDEQTAATYRGLVETGRTNNMIAAAGLIKGLIGKSLRGWLTETVGRLEPSNPAVIEAIRDLRLPVVTTNYDELLEKVTGWSFVTWLDGAAWMPIITGGKPEERQRIIHLHGHFLRPESVVLDASDYQKVLDDEPTQNMMRTIVSTKSLLLVGFGSGIEDPNFDSLRQFLARVLPDSHYPHFRLMSDDQLEHARAEHAQDENIRVIGYGKHQELATSLKGLRPRLVSTGNGTARSAPQAAKRVLEIEIGNGKVRAKASADPDPDPEEAEVRLELDRLRLNLDMVQFLEEQLRIQGDLDPASPGREARLLGRILYELVFQGEVKKLYDRRREGVGKLLLILKVRQESQDLVTITQTVDLSSLPWELLYGPEGWLAIDQKLILSRARPDRTPMAWQRPSDRQTILVVVAQPPEVIEAVQREWPDEQFKHYQAKLKAIVDSLEGLKEPLPPKPPHSAVKDVRWLKDQDPPTVENLKKALDADGQEPADILHYIGYGSFDPLTRDGNIALVAEDGVKADWISYMEFAEQFQLVESPPKMVFLHLCPGPQNWRGAANRDFVRASFTPLARQLLDKGVRLVVAMQYPMSPDAGRQFTETFYEDLKETTVADAVQRARRAVAQRHRLGGPLLYMASDDGLLVPATSTSAGAAGGPSAAELAGT